MIFYNFELYITKRHAVSLDSSTCLNTHRDLIRLILSEKAYIRMQHFGSLHY